jgi:hypothetical protein
VETAYGHVPSEAIDWIRSTIRVEVDTFAANLGRLQEEPMRGETTPAERQRYVVRGASDVLRDLELALAEIQLRHEKNH